MALTKFKIIGLRDKLPKDVGPRNVIDVCTGNDTPGLGAHGMWDWANPTNKRVHATHPWDAGCTAVSVEAMWQGCKIFEKGGLPDWKVLAGEWRRAQGRVPLGHWAGRDRNLHNLFQARVNLFAPCYIQQVLWMLKNDPMPGRLVKAAKETEGVVYLRDRALGEGFKSEASLSHAWFLATLLEGDEEAHIGMGPIALIQSREIHEIWEKL